MATAQAGGGVGPSVKKVLKRFCQFLSPVKVLRRIRVSIAHSPDGTGTPHGRRALQTSIAALDVAFSIAGAIPGVGTTVKGSLEALCKILRGIEQRFQNSEAAERLVDRLAALGDSLSAVQSPDALLRALIRRLDSIKDELDSLLLRPGICYSDVAQALAEFTSQINSCQIDYLTVTQSELVARTQVTDVENINTQCVQVVDPFGFLQPILRLDIGNIEVVATTILRRYDANPFLKTELDYFISRGLYELTMDDGKYIQVLTRSSVTKGTTVVMSVILVGLITHQEELHCPVCKGCMSMQDEGREVCATCDRRVSAIESSNSIGEAPEHEEHPTSTYSLFRHITLGRMSTLRIKELVHPHGDSNIVKRSGHAEEADKADKDTTEGETDRERVDAEGLTEILSPEVSKEQEIHANLRSSAAPKGDPYPPGPQVTHPTYHRTFNDESYDIRVVSPTFMDQTPFFTHWKPTS